MYVYVKGISLLSKRVWKKNVANFCIHFVLRHLPHATDAFLITKYVSVNNKISLVSYFQGIRIESSNVRQHFTILKVSFILVKYKEIIIIKIFIYKQHFQDLNDNKYDKINLKLFLVFSFFLFRYIFIQ